VTYHDPCFLGRHNRIYEPPRELLGSDVNLDLVENAPEAGNSRCVAVPAVLGHGWKRPVETRIASARVDQALSTGATTVATACPFCTQMLDSAIPSEADLEVKDVAVLLLEGVHRGKEGTRPRQ
jgi:Fe-S oxidoreductase